MRLAGDDAARLAIFQGAVVVPWPPDRPCWCPAAAECGLRWPGERSAPDSWRSPQSFHTRAVFRAIEQFAAVASDTRWDALGMALAMLQPLPAAAAWPSGGGWVGGGGECRPALRLGLPLVLRALRQQLLQPLRGSGILRLHECHLVRQRAADTGNWVAKRREGKEKKSTQPMNQLPPTCLA